MLTVFKYAATQTHTEERDRQSASITQEFSYSVVSQNVLFKLDARPEICVCVCVWDRANSVLTLLEVPDLYLKS